MVRTRVVSPEKTTTWCFSRSTPSGSASRSLLAQLHHVRPRRREVEHDDVRLEAGERLGPRFPRVHPHEPEPGVALERGADPGERERVPVQHDLQHGGPS